MRESAYANFMTTRPTRDERAVDARFHAASIVTSPNIDLGRSPHP